MSEVLAVLCDWSVFLSFVRTSTHRHNFISRGEGISQNREGTTQVSGILQKMRRYSTLGKKGPPDNGKSNQSNRRSLEEHNTPTEDIVDGPFISNNEDKDPVPVASPAPIDWFSEITNEILDLTDQFASVALFGSIGVGKSFVARTVLEDDRTKAEFGENRHFVRCDDLANSLDGFLERVSDTIHTTPTQLERCLRSSPPLILLLDGIDCVLDPLAPEAEEICAMIEEFGRFEHVCLVTTSRMYADIHGFQRVEVPTPPEGHARDVFYNLCDLARSPAMDTLIAKLDSHLFSIELIARTIRENSWDEEMLVKAWDDHTSALRTNYYQRLKDTIEPVFRSPRIKELGTTARDVLGAIASFRSGIGEHQLEGIFHGTGGVRAVVDELCRFSLVHRKDGVLTMLSPLKFYFLESMIVHAETEEVIRWGPDCMPARGGTSSSLDLFCCFRVTVFCSAHYLYSGATRWLVDTSLHLAHYDLPAC